jgi:hypothetical protein
MEVSEIQRIGKLFKQKGNSMIQCICRDVSMEIDVEIVFVPVLLVY